MQTTKFYHAHVTKEFTKLTLREYVSVGNYLANEAKKKQIVIDKPAD
jgi:hypothetical protein